MHALLHWVPPTLQQATVNPHLRWRLLDTHGQVWVSLFWGHCSFLLDPGVQKVLFVLSKSLFPQSCVSSGSSLVELVATSSKRVYAVPRPTTPRAPAPAAGHFWPIPPQETLKHSSGCLWGVSGSWCAQGLFESSKCLWQAWGLILSVILPLLPSCWGFPLPLYVGYLFFCPWIGGIWMQNFKE